MNLKNLFLVNAVLAFIFGLAFLLFPDATLGQYGVGMMPKSGLLMSRLFSANLLGVAVISWFVMSAGASETREAIVLGFFVIDAAAFIVSLQAQLGGVVNSLGWSTVAIYLVLGLGFGYFRFMKPSS